MPSVPPFSSDPLQARPHRPGDRREVQSLCMPCTPRPLRMPCGCPLTPSRDRRPIPRAEPVACARTCVPWLHVGMLGVS
ncbi:hypothetical protein LZ31DRAFT_198595 [Colletotrichum somersetense]|nr:hypothetical protein LZ31DRAFT_198595 [Colletotrichum somersetense]